MAYRTQIQFSSRQFFKDVGGIAQFTIRYFKNIFRYRFEWREFINQCYKTGYQSLLLIGVLAFILGLVLTIQIRPVVAGLGAESWMPSLVFISIVTELGPVMFALIFAGKVGSGIGAELSSMRVSDQIDAMEVSATKPFNFLVVSRVTATTVMLPILIFFGDFLAFIGSFVGLKAYTGITFKLFYYRGFSDFFFRDIMPATIKSIFFGFFIGLISCYMGYNSGRGTEGVGKAANAAVVAASLVIFLLDLMAVQLADLLIVFPNE